MKKIKIHLGFFWIMGLSIALLNVACQNHSSIRVSTIKCNDKIEPLGVYPHDVSFSWQMTSAKRNQWQSAWQVVVAKSKEAVTSGDYIWNSGKQKGKQNLHVAYNGPALEAGRRYYWRVKVWDKNEAPSNWSPIGSFATGLTKAKDWQGAEWIGYETLSDSRKVVPGIHGFGNSLGARAKQRPVIPRFRHEFRVDKPVEEALLYITGVGQYEASLDGSKIGDQFLSPGWTDYQKTVLYNTYDVTDKLKTGLNTIGVVVGNGFYNINRERYRKLVIAYGMPKMICQLRLRFKDGTTKIISSGPDWQTAPSPIAYTSIYGGEDYDARREQPGWNKIGFDSEDWKHALSVEAPEGDLRSQQSYPVAIADTFQVQQINQPAQGVYIYDFGQNASGIVRIKVKGKKGQKIRLTPSELLDDKGLANQNASGKPYYYTYTLKGNGVETWQPKFTYYGFRYVQVEGAVPDSVSTDAKPQLVDMEFFHTRNSAPQAGHFETSFQLFNRIYSLINWAIRSNLQSVITDCPHREKLGWLEQTYLMGGSIHYNYGLHHLYTKTIHDMMDAQTPAGLVPDIAPEYVHFKNGFRDSPEWGSASVVLPWLLYKWYGDSAIVKEAWPMMTRYVDFLKSKSDNNILSYGLGDWYDLGPDFPGPAQLTPKSLTATAIYYYDIKLISKMAKVAGKPKEKAKYVKWAAQLKKAFNNRFYDTSRAIYSTGSQTAMAMPLEVGLVNEADQQEIFSNLVDSIKANNRALTAGDVGFHFLVSALHEGRADQLIYDMNARSDVPGYGYQLKKGATSLTESWAALKEVSNNHLMLGHLMQWFYSGLAGIQQTEDSQAYKHILIEPEMVGKIKWTKAWYSSPNGHISSQWKMEGQKGQLSIKIPVNSTATVIIPSGQPAKIKESGTALNLDKNIQVISNDQKRTTIKVGSGTYNFQFINSSSLP